jgi:hypothetical protein
MAFGFPHNNHPLFIIRFSVFILLENPSQACILKVEKQSFYSWDVFLIHWCFSESFFLTGGIFILLNQKSFNERTSHQIELLL